MQPPLLIRKGQPLRAEIHMFLSASFVSLSALRRRRIKASGSTITWVGGVLSALFQGLLKLHILISVGLQRAQDCTYARQRRSARIKGTKGKIGHKKYVKNK